MQLVGQTEPYAFTFFSDIVNHPSVSDAAQSVLESIKIGMGALVRHLGEWHAEYKSLWGMKRVSVCMWVCVGVGGTVCVGGMCGWYSMCGWYVWWYSMCGGTVCVVVQYVWVVSVGGTVYVGGMCGGTVCVVVQYVWWYSMCGW